MCIRDRNVADYYICRVPECACVGRKCDWADDAKFGGGHIACPRCGTWHRPFASGSSGRLACNKVMTVQVDAGDKPLSLDGK
eukprot:14361467-Alexandrium_andersonii.AAC.1